jgi:sirohydrochlorin cobaltochelatase
MRDLTQALSDWLKAGGERVGEIAIRRGGDGWELRHADDWSRDDLQTHIGPEPARHLANLDDAGNFRPLKTAPNLAHGWRLLVADLAGLRRALDYFYPAMWGVWSSHARGELSATPLRETLGRQTGMYRVTQKITDEQALAMVGRFCAGCLKKRLWGLVDAGPLDGLEASPTLPLLCQEACNLLVAEARKVVKGSPP